ncbi:hypothetical protein QR680_010323 [Steinernema hermaphroditum]|uniref:Uncharacterized protein n=1 Tax=Steinernema hermaphroditum TaxID=289476 RepID=A0AA39MBI0_9BILA|nr:hypothetical protein QR680_010323 [Steinernema hermaphroditum]
METVSLDFITNVYSYYYKSVVKNFFRAGTVWSGAAKEFDKRIFDAYIVVYLPPWPDAAFVLALIRDSNGNFQRWHHKQWEINWPFGRIRQLMLCGVGLRCDKNWRSETLEDVSRLCSLPPADGEDTSLAFINMLNKMDDTHWGWTIIPQIHPGFKNLKFRGVTSSLIPLFRPFFAQVYYYAKVKSVDVADFPFGNSMYAAPINTFLNFELRMKIMGKGSGINQIIMGGFEYFAKRRKDMVPRSIIITTPFLERKFLRHLKKIHTQLRCKHVECEICARDFDVETAPLDEITFVAHV